MKENINRRKFLKILTWTTLGFVLAEDQVKYLTRTRSDEFNPLIEYGNSLEPEDVPVEVINGIKTAHKLLWQAEIIKPDQDCCFVLRNTGQPGRYRNSTIYLNEKIHEKNGSAYTSEVVVHEYGHWIDDQLNPYPLAMMINQNGVDLLSEAFIGDNIFSYPSNYPYAQKGIRKRSELFASFFQYYVVHGDSLRRRINTLLNLCQDQERQDGGRVLKAYYQWWYDFLDGIEFTTRDNKIVIIKPSTILKAE